MFRRSPSLRHVSRLWGHAFHGQHRQHLHRKTVLCSRHLILRRRRRRRRLFQWTIRLANCCLIAISLLSRATRRLSTNSISNRLRQSRLLFLESMLRQKQASFCLRLVPALACLLRHMSTMAMRTPGLSRQVQTSFFSMRLCHRQ